MGKMVQTKDFLLYIHQNGNGSWSKKKERKKLLFLCECFSLSMNYVALHVKSFFSFLPIQCVYAEVDMCMPMDM